ncbi:MAG: DUF4124 domain-containing protein [Xanthomonadales bacterium]|nr:DUF4124 domain-containing protein [Xanthomonadales bacterium]
MRTATILLMIFIATLVMWVPETGAQDEIYRWVDENGVVHFGDRPDSQGSAEIVAVQKDVNSNNQDAPQSEPSASGQQPDAAPSYAQQVRDERAERLTKAAAVKKETEAACEKVSQYLAAIEPSTRVMVTGEDGTVTRMDGEVRAQKVAESKAFLAEHCNK